MVEQQSLDQRLEEILSDHGAWLRRTVATTCSSRSDIDPHEVEQDVRLRLWKALQREPDVRHPASYLRRVVVTSTIDAIRRIRARREEQLVMRAEEPSNPAAIDPVAASPGPEEQVLDRQRGDAVLRCLERLPDNRRTAVKLYLQGFNYQEVADLLRWTEAKARNLVSRGMQNLRQQLEAEGVHRD